MFTRSLPISVAGWRAIACLFAVFATLAAGLAAAFAQTPITVAVGKTDGANFPTVSAFVTLADAAGRPVLGVGPEAWELVEDGKPVRGVQVGNVVNAQEPLHVVLTVDTSGSMNGRAIEDAKLAATTFVQGLGPQDRAAVIAFADKPTVVQPFSGNKDELTRAIASLKAAGETSLFDAMVASAQQVGQQQAGRRVVVLLSDGEDTVSKAKSADALAAMQQVGAPVFTVGLGAQVDRGALGGLATGTGGVALYAPSSADLRAAFTNIADQLRNQYVLTFNSTVTPDNGRHALLVRARVGNAQAEANAVFVATSIPPEITVTSPEQNQLVRGKVPVEVKVKAVSAVKRVEVTAAGRIVGSVEKEPYRFEWDTGQLAAGSHVIDITATDALGNRATRQVQVRVEALPTAVPQPTATPQPTPTPIPVSSGSESDQLLIGSAAVFAALALALVVVRRSRRQHSLPSVMQRMPKDKPIANCPTCGRALKRGQECPECRAKDQETIQQRLRELGEDPGSGTGDAEGRR